MFDHPAFHRGREKIDRQPKSTNLKQRIDTMPSSSCLPFPTKNNPAGNVFRLPAIRPLFSALLCLLAILAGTSSVLFAEGTLTTLHNFVRGTGGENPQSELALGNDDNFYGTTPYGGINGEGTAFKMTPTGEVTTLHNFSNMVDGYIPNRLILGHDGNFYGTCFDGGGDEGKIGTYGTLFKMTSNGTVTVLHKFLAGGNDGWSPKAGLVQGTDGNFYGTTAEGGTWAVGTIFKITIGGAFTTLHSLALPEDGAHPQAELIQARDGDLYGTTFDGGSFGGGTVFKITTGGNFTLLHAFDYYQNTGIQPAAALVQGVDGNFYGTTSEPAGGSIFQMTAEGDLTTLHTFTGQEGGHSIAPLVQGLDGCLYGTSLGGTTGGTLFKVSTVGELTVLHSFEYNGADGCQPEAGMILDASGDLFGTTFIGGENHLGTTFKITPSGVFTSLYSFFGGSDCYYSAAPLVQGSDGAFYGTSAQGGSSESGAIFKITIGGQFDIVHSFTGKPGDGSDPQTGLLEGSDGAFYGTTRFSGIFGASIFKVTPAGLLTTLHNFTDPENGTSSSGLIEGADGQLYGTIPSFGLNNPGSVYKMTLDGVMTTVHAFTGGVEYDPEGRLCLASDGIFYGTTYSGGIFGKGSIFSLTPDGLLTTLYSFTGNASDGAYPKGGLVEGTNGSLYGTTTQGDRFGTVFKITKAGLFTILHSFVGSPFDGAYPNPDLIRADDGNIYGTTAGGGMENAGTIFQVSAADSYSVTYSFKDSLGQGIGPQAGVIEGDDGKLYGTTIAGGLHDFGTVFQFSLPGSETRVPLLQGDLDFGNVGVGTSKTAAFRIKNTGNAPLHVTSILRCN